MTDSSEPSVADRRSDLQTGALSRIRIVLCAPSHPGNIGAAARAMRTMGLSQLVLVAPQRFPDAEADALASGATGILRAARIVDTLDAALAGAALAIGFSARPREFAGAAMPVRAAAHEAFSYAARGEVALVFGSEMSGLSNAELARCQLVATIPSDPSFSSLNLAAAVQIAAYELRSSRRRKTRSRGSSSTASARWSRSISCVLRIPSGCCRGCGGCSHARGWKRRR